MCLGHEPILWDKGMVSRGNGSPKECVKRKGRQGCHHGWKVRGLDELRPFSNPVAGMALLRPLKDLCHTQPSTTCTPSTVWSSSRCFSRGDQACLTLTIMFPFVYPIIFHFLSTYIHQIMVLDVPSPRFSKFGVVLKEHALKLKKAALLQYCLLSGRLNPDVLSCLLMLPLLVPASNPASLLPFSDHISCIPSVFVSLFF